EPPPEPVSEPSSIFFDEPAAPEPVAYEPIASWDPVASDEPFPTYVAPEPEPVMMTEPAAITQPAPAYETPKFSLSDLSAAEESLFAAAEKGVFSRSEPQPITPD